MPRTLLGPSKAASVRNAHVVLLDYLYMDSMRGNEARSDRFERTLGCHGDALWRLAGAYTGELQDREDLYQEILMAVWQALPRFRGDSSERTFVFRVAHNRAITFQKRSRRHTPKEPLPDLVDGSPTPADDAITRDEHDRLRRAVHALLPPAREVLSLALEGLSNQEIAEVLGISGGNVAVRLHRARQSLRRALEPHETPR